jgi:hypothetical protein
MPAVTFRVFGSLAGLATAMGMRVAAISQSPAPVVKIDSGELQGGVGDGVVSFKGASFAAPPVGELSRRRVSHAGVRVPRTVSGQRF